MDELQYFERIEKYKDGLLSKDEKRQFEADLKINADLQKEYKAFLASTVMLEWMAKEELENKKNTSQSNELKTRKSSSKKWWIAAAAAAILVLCSLSYANLNYSNKVLAEESYSIPNWSNLVRGNKDLLSNAEIEKAFASNNYDQAIRLLERNKNKSTSANYLLGNAYFLNDQSTKAISIFKKIADLSGNHKAAVEWYLVLSYLKANEVSNANKQLEFILQQSNHPNKDKAKALAQKLETNWRTFVFID